MREGKEMDFLEVIFQTVIAFVVILVLTMILGKQQIAQMTYFEYINGITFGSIAATLATDIDQHTWQHLIGLVLFGGLTLLLSYLSLKNRKARRWLEGDPVIVIQNGQIMEENLKKNRFHFDEVMELLRQKGVFDISQVQQAVLENDGQITVMLKPQYQPLTKDSMAKPSGPANMPIELVIDGQVIYENLQKAGKNGQWLMNQIRKQKGVQSLRDVFYASLQSDGTLYVDVRNDQA
jgi:uncharacterized membrane protein YcaP (DUF421 family)